MSSKIMAQRIYVVKRVNVKRLKVEADTLSAMHLGTASSSTECSSTVPFLSDSILLMRLIDIDLV